MKRSSYKLLLLFTILIVILATTAFVSAESEFAGGDGTVNNPYQITTKEHLDNVRNYPNANFKLMNDIVFEDTDFKQGGTFYNANGRQTYPIEGKTYNDCGWIPIPELNGCFDGNNHVIVNLYQCHTQQYGEAIASFIVKIGADGCVKNLHVKNCNFIVDWAGSVSGIAAENFGMIENCTVSGKLQQNYMTTQGYGAGIAYNNAGTISNSANLAHFINHARSSYYGGLAYHNTGTITNSINAGNLSNIDTKKTPELSYKYPTYFGLCNDSTGTIVNTVNLADCESAIYESTGVMNNVVNCFAGTNTHEERIIYKAKSQINEREYTTNAVALDNLSKMNVSENVTNLKSEGNTYKSIKLTWDPVPGAAKYRIYRGIFWALNSNLQQELPYLTEVDAVNGCSYIDSENIDANSTYDFHYTVAPVFVIGGVEFIGAHSKRTNAKVIDTNSSSWSTDTMGPYIGSFSVLTKETYSPGAIKTHLKANDNANKIVRVTFKVHKSWLNDWGYINSHEVEECFEGDYGKSFDREFDIPITNSNKGESIKITEISLVDEAGNITTTPVTMFDRTVVTVGSEFDIEFKGALSNGNIVRQLEIMEEGKTVVLTIDEASKGVLRKEVLDAIKGKDKTVIVYVDDQGSAQWVFYGKDITGETKDLKLKAKINKVNGKILGLNSDVLEMVYEDNGSLPGKVNFRVKSDYLSSIYKVNSSFFLYYKNGKKVELESTECTAIRDGSAYWCYVDLKHNSTFYLTGEAAKTSEIIEVTDEQTPSTDNSGGTPENTPTPDTNTEKNHTHSYTKSVTKATAKKNGKIEMKCTCGAVKSTTVINKASGTKLKISSYLYNGKKKTAPKIIVKDSKGKTISSKYYTITKPKKTLKAIGNYTYTVKFKGDKYKGTKKLVLTIKPAKPTIKAPKAAKKAVTVKWKGVKKVHATGYQVMVATNKKFTKNVKKSFVKGYSKRSYKMTKLKAKKTYYIKVRTYKTVKGVKIYSNWSKVKSCKTK